MAICLNLQASPGSSGVRAVDCRSTGPPFNSGSGLLFSFLFFVTPPDNSILYSPRGEEQVHYYVWVFPTTPSKKKRLNREYAQLQLSTIIIETPMTANPLNVIIHKAAEGGGCAARATIQSIPVTPPSPPASSNGDCGCKLPLLPPPEYHTGRNQETLQPGLSFRDKRRKNRIMETLYMQNKWEELQAISHTQLHWMH